MLIIAASILVGLAFFFLIRSRKRSQ
jgi:hypothetical protein